MARRIPALGFPAALLVTLVLAGPAAAAPAVSGEFPLVGKIDTNNKLARGPDGNMWVTLQGPEKDVAKITPAGEITEYDLAVAGASGIVTGPDGNLWVTRPGGLTRFSAADPVGSKAPFEIATITGNSPITVGPDAQLWVATQNLLLRVTLAKPAEPTPFAVPGLDPKDIDSTSFLVVADAGSSRVLFSTVTGILSEFKLSGQAQGVAADPSGQVAFTQPVTPPKEIGLLSPAMAPLVLSAEGTDPFGIALGPDGAYWSAEFISDGLTRLTPTGQLSDLTGFAKGSGPRQVAAGPGNTLWVTLTMTNKIGRVSGVEVEPPVVTPPPTAAIVPETTIKAGPKGRLRIGGKRRKVKFRFQSPNLGVGFECRLKRLPRKPTAKASKAVFAPCQSPRAYRRGPGRYRFAVRAVLDGVADPSPAVRGFRIVRAHRK
ncbi:MAG TPA: hypothetical protein VK889_10385 [Solirubrobacterales bacterium]|nr:hypothetical protein [Solirubrobacterales bacterium]